MNELSLFTGAGGGCLGSKLLGWRTVGYVEINDYCQKVIAQRIKDGIFDEAPIFGDIRSFIGEGFADSYHGMVDVVTAGFPCQPFSVAGLHKGEDDERNMWPETIEVIRRVRPKFALLENVPGLLHHKYFGRILGDLAEAGFDAEWGLFSPCFAEDRFRGARLWVLATSRSIGWDFPTHETGMGTDSREKTQRAWCQKGNVSQASHGGRIYCFPNTDTRRSFDDVADWPERLKAVGNGQIPGVVVRAWRELTDR